ncbi:protein DEPP1 [Pelodytes ibericus]
MRSQLLFSINQLPTIREDPEANSHCEATGADTHSNGLEEYVKSIQTLAQPCSLAHIPQQGLVRNQRRTRLRFRSSRCSEGKVLTPTQESTCYATLVALQTNADPLAWIYRQSGKENKDCQDPPAVSPVTLPQTLHSVFPTSLCKTTVTSRRQASSKDQSIEKQRPQEKRSRSQHLPKKSRSNTYSSPTSVHSPQLPVIYEL